MKTQNKTADENQRVSGGSYLNLGLYAFAGLGMEVLCGYGSGDCA